MNSSEYLGGGLCGALWGGVRVQRGPGVARRHRAGEDVPVQNGKANYTIEVPIEFQPNCSPPMRLVLISGTVTDVTNGISATF